jgi:Right handed beta helix region
MSRIGTIALLLAAVVISTLASTQAHAVQRTHVSAAIGDDINTAANCTPVAPCRTFQAAMTVTDVNGEVVVLDSGGYGAVNITQSVSLIAPKGVYAGISVFPNADGVTISGRSGINVVLRGLTVNGQGGNDGIVITTGNKLTVENCVISNLARNGVVVQGNSIVRIIDTIVRDNGSDGVGLFNGVRATITRAIVSGNGGSGIRVETIIPTTKPTTDIANSTIDGNRFAGVFASSNSAEAPVIASIRDSRIVNHRTGFGIAASTSSGGTTSLSASNNIISNNSIGISSGGAGTKVWASGNTVSGNTAFGLQNAGGTFASAFASDGNNAVRNNGTDTSGNIVTVGTK